MDSNHRSKKQQIYSLPPLATREPLRIKLCFAKLSRIAATLIVYHVSKYLSTLFFNFFQNFLKKLIFKVNATVEFKVAFTLKRITRHKTSHYHLKYLQQARLPHGRRSSRSEPKLKQPNRLKTPTVPPLILFTKKVNILRKIS